jgi:hypothetical protein
MLLTAQLYGHCKEMEKHGNYDAKALVQYTNTQQRWLLSIDKLRSTPTYKVQ